MLRLRIISAKDWSCCLKVRCDVIRVRDIKCARIQGYDRKLRNAKNSFVLASPRVLDYHVAGEVLRLLLYICILCRSIFRCKRRRCQTGRAIIDIIHGLKEMKRMQLGACIRAEKPPAPNRFLAAP
ncbi:hypothetical protein KP509_32G022000 [Ceratopteris richardii]|uniref:Uncharacterized protein n=1 Tax=Ceratopteris richardii TaxID=49495 RepID=A0A8T2QRZ7_CERRI|nr:hypothetical protein KP509_32G022000 [Ceratopteris richardii]